MNFDALAALVDSLRTWPEPASLPEALDGASRTDLAEARSRLQQIGQRATEIRRIIDRELAGQIAGGALRYGDEIIRPAKRGTHFVVNPILWWDKVIQAIRRVSGYDAVTLLDALYPVDSVRLSALPQLAKILDVDPTEIRDNLIDHKKAEPGVEVVPIFKAPKWAQRLSEGQYSGERKTDAAT